MRPFARRSLVLLSLAVSSCGNEGPSSAGKTVADRLNEMQAKSEAKAARALSPGDIDSFEVLYPAWSRFQSSTALLSALSARGLEPIEWAYIEGRINSAYEVLRYSAGLHVTDADLEFLRPYVARLARVIEAAKHK